MERGLDDGVFIERHKASALANVLPESFVRKYFSTIDTETLAAYERALHAVSRWQDSDHKKYPVHESVLDHVIGILEMLNEFEREYPVLAASLNMEDLRLMAILHDAGETLRGDVPASAQVQGIDVTQRAKTHGIRNRRKESEQRWSLRLIKRISDSKTREYFSDLIRREQIRATDDREAQMMKFFDLARDLRFGTDNVFPIRRTEGHTGYRGTGQSRDADSYAIRCAAIMKSLDPDTSAKRDFADLAEKRMFAVLEKNDMPQDDLEKIRRSVAL